MVWKTVFIAIFAVGALAEIIVTDDQRQQVKKAIKEQCEKHGAGDKVEDVEAAVRNFIDCGKSIIDPDTLKKEIEEAKPNGSLDEVFKKYCAKSPQVKTCIHSLGAAISPCVDPKIREHLDTFNRASDQLIDFVCYKDGDRIALFIAEGGPECFQEKTVAIRDCAMKLKDDVPTVEAAKSLSTQEQCQKFEGLGTCIVNALEGCATPTPANMAEALIKFIRNGTPCKKD